MLKRFEVWTMGAMVPMILAGCASTPTTAPAAQPQQTVKASFTTQGGDQGAPAQLSAAPSPCGECPATVPYSVSPFGLYNLQQITANPILDYSWYYARGNFADFGWAPGFYAQLQNFMWYPTASGVWPYAYNPGAGAYLPYSTVYGGATVYPYLSGLMQGSYAGMEQRRGGMDRDDDRQDGGQHQGGWGQGGGQGMGQGQGQGQGMGQGRGY